MSATVARFLALALVAVHLVRADEVWTRKRRSPHEGHGGGGGHVHAEGHFDHFRPRPVLFPAPGLFVENNPEFVNNNEVVVNAEATSTSNGNAGATWSSWNGGSPWSSWNGNSWSTWNGNAAPAPHVGWRRRRWTDESTAPAAAGTTEAAEVAQDVQADMVHMVMDDKPHHEHHREEHHEHVEAAPVYGYAAPSNYASQPAYAAQPSYTVTTTASTYYSAQPVYATTTAPTYYSAQPVYATTTATTYYSAQPVYATTTAPTYYSAQPVYATTTTASTYYSAQPVYSHPSYATTTTASTYYSAPPTYYAATTTAAPVYATPAAYVHPSYTTTTQSTYYSAPSSYPSQQAYSRRRRAADDQDIQNATATPVLDSSVPGAGSPMPTCEAFRSRLVTSECHRVEEYMTTSCTQLNCSATGIDAIHQQCQVQAPGIYCEERCHRVKHHDGGVCFHCKLDFIRSLSESGRCKKWNECLFGGKICPKGRREHNCDEEYHYDDHHEGGHHEGGKHAAAAADNSTAPASS